MMHKILLIDGNRSLAAMQERVLLEAGYEVALAHDLNTTSDQLRCGGLSLVIAELALPELAENDAVSLLRQVQRLRPGIPMLVLTSNTNRAAHREARSLGVWDICTKPTRCAELLSITKNILADAYPQRSGSLGHLLADAATGD